MARCSWFQTLKKFMFRRSRSRFWKAECRGLFIRVRTPDQSSERQHESSERLSTSHGSSVELLEYARLTLQLIERHPHSEEDAHLACELKFSLERYIEELERECVFCRVGVTPSPCLNPQTEPTEQNWADSLGG
jgi:hypothetical protein